MSDVAHGPLVSNAVSPNRRKTTSNQINLLAILMKVWWNAIWVWIVAHESPVLSRSLVHKNNGSLISIYMYMQIRSWFFFSVWINERRLSVRNVTSSDVYYQMYLYPISVKTALTPNNHSFQFLFISRNLLDLRYSRP